MEFFNATKNMSTEELTVELMKSRCSGKNTLQYITSLLKSMHPCDFFYTSYDGMFQQEIMSLTNTRKNILMVSSNTVVVTSLYEESSTGEDEMWIET